MKNVFVLVFIVDTYVNWVFAADCACATTGVNVRDGAGTTHNILTLLQPGNCLTYKNHRQSVNGADWVNVDYNGQVRSVSTVHCEGDKFTKQSVSFGNVKKSSYVDIMSVLCNIRFQDGWIHSAYVNIHACSGGGGGSNNDHVQLPGCPHIVTRAEWGARTPSSPLVHLTLTPKYMFIHHGGTPNYCHTKAECINQVKEYQNYHMDGHGTSDGRKSRHTTIIRPIYCLSSPININGQYLDDCNGVMLDLLYFINLHLNKYLL